jgi:hypothetical protein
MSSIILSSWKCSFPQKVLNVCITKAIHHIPCFLFNISTTSLFYMRLWRIKKNHTNTYVYNSIHWEIHNCVSPSNPKSIADASSLLVLHDYVMCSYLACWPSSSYCLIHRKLKKNAMNLKRYDNVRQDKSTATSSKPPKKLCFYINRTINTLVGIQSSANPDIAKMLHNQRWLNIV